MTSNPRVSVAVPVYNEAPLIPELIGRIGVALDDLPGGPHEIVVVDDGSFDGTVEALEEAAEEEGRLLVIVLSRNFGHQMAITAAMDHVTGDAVVVMDGDLQDPPEAIGELLEKFTEGFDVVYAQRVRRQEPLWLRASYFLFYRLLARLADLPLPVDAGDFAIISRRVVEQLHRAPERHRYLRGLRTWVGFRQIGIPVQRAPRHSGSSKYTLSRLFRLAFDGIFAFSIVPLRAATVLGAITVLLAVLFAAYSLYTKIFLESPRGFTASILIMTFMSGIVLLFLGVIGEYVGRIYEEVKGRPLYIVARQFGGKNRGTGV
jgi:dolichol-phosphate mannosyltransferase